MKPLFPNKNNLELISGPNDARKKYKINADCVYLSPRQEKTGNETIDGDYYKVPTDAGHLAVVWVANDQSIADNLKYFCHGHSFGTYKKFGYSLAEVNERALDEWDIVGKTVDVNRTGSEIVLEQMQGLHELLREASISGHRLVAVCLAEPGFWDNLIVSFHNRAPTRAALETIHSFRIRKVSEREQDFLESSASSKNTFGHFDKNTTIKGQLEMYARIAKLTFLRSKSKRNND